MPAGIDVTVHDGTATIDFVDSSLKGAALHRLNQAGAVAVLTREGPRRLYRCSEEAADKAGLIDRPAPPVAAPAVKRGPGRPKKDVLTEAEREADKQAAKARAELKRETAETVTHGDTSDV